MVGNISKFFMGKMKHAMNSFFTDSLDYSEEKTN